jgi:hypothetical protein
LTTFFGEPPQRGRGRPTELGEPELQHRRDQLIQTFEDHWPEIGYDLRRCKKSEDLINIFHPFSEGHFRDSLSACCRPSTAQASADALRKVRAERRSLTPLIRRAGELSYQAQEQLQRLDSELIRAPKKTWRIIKRERKKRRKDAWKAASEYRTLSDTDRRLRVRLEELEASFTRRELFRFLKSRRYALTPVNLANAAAGLPYTGWRQSMRRCIKAPHEFSEGRTYRIFKAIRYLVSTANKASVNALVSDFRQRIPLLPSRYELPRSELAENWLFLERATRQVFRTRPHPKALPFEITKRYLKGIQVRSQVDLLVATQARLKLPGKLPASPSQDEG